MNDAAKREMIVRAGQLLGDRFHEDFTPGEALVVIAATVDRIVAWMERDDAICAIASLKEYLDQLERERKGPLH